MKYLKYFKLFESVAEENDLILLRTGERFWVGLVDFNTGYIEEVHTYEEAEAADFNIELYFDQTQEQDSDYFFGSNLKNGPDVGCEKDIPEEILNKIKEQTEKVPIHRKRADEVGFYDFKRKREEDV